MITRGLSSILLLAASLCLTACGGGGSGGSVPATGNVAVIFTDGPTDQYQRILISMDRMTLIGPGGHEDLYDGPEITFDLLEMSDWADLAFNTKVLAGQYNKIRLYVTKVVLVDVVNDQTQMLSKLPANGKIDLNPRGPFEVSPDYTTVIKLDMDAKRSFQIVETGNGKLLMRPVVFVDIFEGDIFLPDRLVRVFGTVEPGSFESADASDASDDSFRLCDIEFISQSSGPALGDADDCVRVYTDGSTSVFDDTGAQVDFSAVAEDQPLTAVGFVVDTDDSEAFLGLNAVVLELGDRQPDDADGWDTIQGVVDTDPVPCDADQCFEFDPEETDPAVTTRMQPGTRVFRADGAELDQSDVSMEDSGSVDGLPANSELNAALVVLSTDLSSGIVSGTLESIDDASPYKVLEVMTDAGGLVNVCVGPDTSIVQVLIDDEVVTIFDLLDPGVLEQGLLIEAFGDADSPPTGCDMVADQVIVEPPPATP